MKRRLGEVREIINVNLGSILLFELAYWGLLLPLLFQAVGALVRLALRLSGYSYVTVSNLGAFLLKPATLLVFPVILFLILMSIAVEASVLLTAFQAAALSRRMSAASIFTGGALRVAEQLRRRNGKLFLVVANHFLLVHVFLLYRLLWRVKPIKFILTGLLGESWGRLLIILLLTGSAALALPTAFVSLGCMAEQRSFRGGLERSRELLRRNYVQTAATLTICNLLVTAAGVLLYLAAVVMAAFVAVILAGRQMEMAFLLEARDRIEFVLVFFFSIGLTVVNYGALTVLYVQFDRKKRRMERWEFTPVGNGMLRLRRRTVMGLLALVTALSAASVFDAFRGGMLLARDMLYETQITAHRGSSWSAPENTMAALEAAAEEWVDFAEIDVQETKDGVLVLFHDSTLQRIDGSRRSIGRMTWEEVQQVDAGSWFSDDFQGVGIPTLEEAMEFARGRLRLNIEIKYDGAKSLLPEKVAEAIREADFIDQCVVTSTSFSYLERVKAAEPDIYTGYIVSAAYGSYYQDEAVDFISILSSSASRRLVERIHESGKEIHVWTVNTRSELERARLLGVDNVITDRPLLAREVLFAEESTGNLLGWIREMLR